MINTRHQRASNHTLSDDETPREKDEVVIKDTQKVRLLLLKCLALRIEAEQRERRMDAELQCAVCPRTELYPF